MPHIYMIVLVSLFITRCYQVPIFLAINLLSTLDGRDRSKDDDREEDIAGYAGMG